MLELKSQIEEMQGKINWLIRCAKEQKGVGLGLEVGCGLKEDLIYKGPQPVKLNKSQQGPSGDAKLKGKMKAVGLGLSKSPRKIWKEKGLCIGPQHVSGLKE